MKQPANLVKPKDVEALSRLLKEADQASAKLPKVDARHLNHLIEHTPEDMTATAQAGLGFDQFQTKLGKAGQWLPLDPVVPARFNLGSLIATNASGPRRLGYGTVRDYLIGIQVILANGSIVRSGGKVVKNVAGFDLAKLFVGSQNSLGIIVEATFKLRPIPERETIMVTTLETIHETTDLAERILADGLSPVILDIHNIAGKSTGLNPPQLVVGFAGDADDVAFQQEALREFGEFTISGLEYEEHFWGQSEVDPKAQTVLPSKLPDMLRTLAGEPFVARAGMGLVYHRSDVEMNSTRPAIQLEQRLKNLFDPKGVLPEIPT